MLLKSLCLSVFVAVTVVPTARAACDVSAAVSCVSGLAGLVGTLPDLQSPATNFTFFSGLCRTVKDAISCVKEATEDCSEEAKEQFKSNFALAENVTKQYCNKAFECYMRMADCIKGEPELQAYMETKITNVNVSYCPATRRVEECLRKGVPQKCHILKNVRKAVSGLRELNDFCVEDSCQAIKTCQTSFYLAGPKTSGLDNKTCTLYGQYASCVESTFASCPGLRPRSGQPLPGKVANLISEACELMADPAYTAIYECATFTSCVDGFMTTKNIFSAQNLCYTLQGVIGCATSTIGSCAGVTDEARQAFIQSANMASLKAAALRCGKPKLYTGNCPEVAQCKNGLKDYATKDFKTQCRSIKTFQGCAFGAMKKCNLTVPGMDDDMNEESRTRDGKMRKPKMDKISDITNKMCTELDGKAVTSCEEFSTCMAGNLPDTDSDFLSEESWCDVGSMYLGCVRLSSDQCPVPDSVNQSANTLQGDFLDEGCPNTFDFLTASDPSSGSDIISGSSLACLLLLAVVAQKGLLVL